MPGSKRSLRSRVAAALVRVAAGLAVGAALAEIAFTVRDHGAFPHLNLYAPDPVLGVRLVPGASMRLAFGGNPVTTVRINASGFRGADFPPPGGDEVVVVGDSQVFGLGVEEDQTFCAELERTLPGAHVIDAGVPTYGPPEYEKVLADLLAKRKPKRVVYVVNFANDLFEAERPDVERHAVWDGWAVRRETAPSHVTSFPGRELLFRRSHAVFALRRWWYRRSGPVEAFSVPSEGTARDIAVAAARAADEHVHAREDTRRLVALRDAELSVAKTDLREAGHRFLDLVNEEQLYTVTDTPGSVWGGRWDPVRASFAEPGDIVGSDDYGEYTGPLYATAELIVKGAEARRRIEEKLRDRAKQDAAQAARIEPVLAAVASAEKRADAVRAEPLPRIRAWSPLAPSLRRVAAMCEAAGARLFVVALPLDVQVSKDEWAKYGTDAVDLAPARILVDDLLDAADAVGATPVDLTDALRAAEPGAFLQHDIHMSPKGHEAVAKALAKALSMPPAPKLAAPTPGRPLGRTLPTPLAAVKQRREIQVPGSTAAGCETYIVDEWLTLRCHAGGVDEAVPIGVRVVDAPLGEAVIHRDAPRDGVRALVMQIPLLQNQSTVVDFRWPHSARRLAANWQSARIGVTVSFRDLDAKDAAAIPAPPAPSPATCAALKAVGIAAPCDEVPLFDDPACLRTYEDDPKAAVACLRGERAPECPRGAAPVGVFQRCAPLCGKDAPCASGTCTPYQGGEVCL